MADKPKKPDPSMLGTGMANKAGNQLKQAQDAQMKRLDQIYKEMGMPNPKRKQ